MQNLPTQIAYIAILLSFILEALIFLNGRFWQNRKYLAGTSMITGAFASGIFVAVAVNVASIFLLFLMVYRTINLLRYIQDRMHQEHLKKVALKSFVVIALLQIVTIVIYRFGNVLYSGNYKNTLFIYSVVTLVVSLVIFITTMSQISASKAKNVKKLNLEKLPTVTLAIPARNEDYAMKECLESAIASDYPKLEIIVIDDCSQDKTPQIIKQFAHDGVRFVQASEADVSWLAKNKAYQTLYEQASGQIIMFMGVDVNLSEGTISQLVNIFVAKKCSMMSVMPSRVKNGLVASLVQPMRYWYELALPIWFKKRPPVLSTCWLINRDTLKDLGEFKSVARAVVPEEHFAKQNSKSYLFVRNSNRIGLTTQKDFISQWQTAIRTHYAGLHKRPEIVMSVSLMYLIFLIGPYAALIYFIIHSFGIAILLITTLSCLLLTASHAAINYVTNKQAFLMSLINFPFVVLVDLAAMQDSMYRYEFDEVIWRGRNITGPTMHVYAHLPKVN